VVPVVLVELGFDETIVRDETPGTGPNRKISSGGAPDVIRNDEEFGETVSA